jgi:hypothetical protein
MFRRGILLFILFVPALTGHQAAKGAKNTLRQAIAAQGLTPDEIWTNRLPAARSWTTRRGLSLPTTLMTVRTRSAPRSTSTVTTESSRNGKALRSGKHTRSRQTLM